MAGVAAGVRKPRVLFLLTYCHPHISGLTIANMNRAEELAARGYAVSVLCSRNRAGLPLEETLRGVRVRRVPVRFRLGKGVWMPGYGRRLMEEAARHDVLVQCLPASPVEAWGAARAARKLRKPLVVDYACDLQLPGGLSARAIEMAAEWGHQMAARQARAMVVSTADYARHSPFASQYLGKMRNIPLTIRISRPDGVAVQALRTRHAPAGEKLIGFAGRMAAEKGIQVLLEATSLLRAKGLPVRLLLAGDVYGVIGEAAYQQRISKLMQPLGEDCRVLGVMEPDLSAFYGACDVLALPSLNRTESFGMVQAEAMLCGTSVVASDLPGVREAVRQTGMGRIVPPGDASALATALEDVLMNPQRYTAPPETIRSAFASERSVTEFEQLLRDVTACA
jgi:glycosyltransferase involved in cell wall biosynthesis